MSLQEAGGDVNPNEVLLSRFQVERHARLRIVGAETMLLGIDSDREVASILHSGKLCFVAIHGRGQGAAYKLLVAVNINRRFGVRGYRLRGCHLGRFLRRCREAGKRQNE